MNLIITHTAIDAAAGTVTPTINEGHNRHTLIYGGVEYRYSLRAIEGGYEVFEATMPVPAHFVAMAGAQDALAGAILRDYLADLEDYAKKHHYKSAPDMLVLDETIQDAIEDAHRRAYAESIVATLGNGTLAH